MELKRTVTLVCDYCGVEETFHYSEPIIHALEIAGSTWQTDRPVFVGGHFYGTLKGHCCEACFGRINASLLLVEWFKK